MDQPVPAPIRLDDLAAPRFSEEARAILDAGAALADDVELTPARLCADALDRSGGATDFGPDGWQEPLDVLCAALRDEAGLSRFGTVSMHAQLVQMLTNRLLVEQYLAEHPAALDRPVERPIVVAGLPRTGTTHLHNLLSADPALRSLPYWEAVEPLPAPGEPTSGDASITPRVDRCAFGLEMSRLWMPEMQRMHEMTPWHTHEEIHLLALDCSTLLFDTLAPMPTWREHYRSSDQTRHYRYVYRVLQALQHARGGQRWVLKSPQHLEQLGPLSTVFPDATHVLTHRDPGDVTVSMVTMIVYAARMHLDRVDPIAISGYWQDLLADLLTACVRDRDLLPPGRSMDVRFDDFMSDELGVVAAAYALADQPLDQQAVGAHREYLATHQRNRHGAVIYEPERIGVDPAAVRARLADYCERFGV